MLATAQPGEEILNLNIQNGIISWAPAGVRPGMLARELFGENFINVPLVSFKDHLHFCLNLSEVLCFSKGVYTEHFGTAGGSCAEKLFKVKQASW